MPAEELGRRPLLASVSGEDVVEVILDFRGRQAVGQCAVTGTTDLSTASATATLRALDAFAPDGVEFRLDWCGLVAPSQQLSPAVVVLASLIRDGVPLPQAGAAIVHHDVQVASVRAALDALNRRLEIWGR